MSSFDPRVDAYIKKAKPFAQPILEHLRYLIHQTCPQAEEKIKWGMPHFDYKGEMMCGIASFKEHCVLGFWKGSLLKDPKGVLEVKERTAMGNLGCIRSMEDLPADKVIAGFIRQAMKLNDDGVKIARTPVAKTDIPDMPAAFASALKKNKKAAEHFKGFTPGKKKDYIIWIAEAKSEATRAKRIETAIEWISEGKGRNWRYEKKK